MKTVVMMVAHGGLSGWKGRQIQWGVSATMASAVERLNATQTTPACVSRLYIEASDGRE